MLNQLCLLCCPKVFESLLFSKRSEGEWGHASLTPILELQKLLAALNFTNVMKVNILTTVL